MFEAARGREAAAFIHSGSETYVPSGRPGRNLLLVSRSVEWAQAVQAAIAAPGDALLTCGADEALSRLAGVANHYTHLLVQDRDADGLTGALADLTTEIADPDTSMLMLGRGDRVHGRNLRVINAAEPRAVQEALMTTPPRSRPDLAADPALLREALDTGSIEIRYQPIIRIADRRPIALEGLARLIHPTLGILHPDQFVPQIEAAGLASQFTEMVSARVFADLLSPHLAGTGIRVSVNFPLDVMLSDAALARLEQQRVASGIPADCIIIELTESQPVRDTEALRRSVTHLRSLGYGVAIDDVGPAVPHLGRLLDLGFTSLKLDKALVSQAATTDVLQYLTETIKLARQHGLAVVAEGVETETTLAQMQSIGVDYVQGFLAARPLPRSAVAVWLKNWSGTPS
jgi:EAL domain-containing protein (putative c-di-GMP-specific phosphodiesterase class I)